MTPSHYSQEKTSPTSGSQSISPFYWAMDSGALTCAQLILEDLLTIRADRDVWKPGMLSLDAECCCWMLFLVAECCCWMLLLDVVVVVVVVAGPHPRR